MWFLDDLHLIATRWHALCEQIERACQCAGRARSGVTILPVTKTFAPQVVRVARTLGLDRFGEGRIQELRTKASALTDIDVDWVMLGHLQTNKVKIAARLVTELQSLDCLKLAQALHHRLHLEGRVMDVLIQVNTSQEPSKHGLLAADLPGFIERLQSYDRLRVCGLMTLAAHTDDTSRVRACFAQLRELRDAMMVHGYSLPRLSMGMSRDFPLAIMEGSTEVRIGTALFGGRA